LQIVNRFEVGQTAQSTLRRLPQVPYHFVILPALLEVHRQCGGNLSHSRAIGELFALAHTPVPFL